MVRKSLKNLLNNNLVGGFYMDHVMYGCVLPHRNRSHKHSCYCWSCNLEASMQYPQWIPWLSNIWISVLLIIVNKLWVSIQLITFVLVIRSRLSYEQFGAFLANVKELNSHKQTKEVNHSVGLSSLSYSNLTLIIWPFCCSKLQETLRKADDIFGPDNKDLYAIFEGLITRNVHWRLI